MTGAETDLRQLSHELRTPLNVILGNVELLLDGSAGPLSAEARASLGEVQLASHRLSRQVQRLLLWSAVRGGDAGAGGSTLDLIALIRDVRATRTAAPLAIEPPDARLEVRGDRSWLQTLMSEILELGGASSASSAPTIGVERGADGASLCFVWPDFGTGEVEPLQMTLIESIAERQGASATLISNGVRLYWP